MLKVSAFYLEKQKSFIPKKNIFKPLSISKQKSFVYWFNFPEGFGLEDILTLVGKVLNSEKGFVSFNYKCSGGK